MGLFDSLKRGLERSREAINEIFYFGGDVDESFWEDLEDTLVMGDMGADISMSVTDDLRDLAARKNLTTARQLREALADRLEETFITPDKDPFTSVPSCVLFVGINGAGKTTTVGKIASAAAQSGIKTVIGSADTFRAAAIEQLDVWGQRAGVPVVKRDRGADPASVCYDVLDVADREGAELVLIDTAGRLHTSADLMRELAKVVNVTRKRAAKCVRGPMPVYVVLVIDAATGQNGLSQALEFNEALGLDGIIMTKLDGTAKGGIAMAVSSKLKLPILRIGVGEQVDDLQKFDAHAFCRALVGED
ncbi:signal recognition particle-docking protein FtsY [Collinsella tanakaei]|uniref:signal recognition particle-docking protein FtsY n=1 Tax=Collinsella tanakaei TaxID=626935 RepID=UPI0025A48C86|nr:signal recognition particle-docking protein FtsY [Collinsella tanakaei]MDM8245020.1 signal recognition particle-docking protein FtsY [Collinsella tanakaei]